MNLTSPAVLATALLVSSPALWDGLVTGEAPASLALSRFLVALLVCWAGLGLVATLVGQAPATETTPGPDDSPQA